MTDNDATQMRQDDAAKQLRTMLDERGVKWRKWIYGNIDLGTVFSASGIEWIALWNPEINKLSITNYKTDLTPEQVIDATVAQDLFIHKSGMNEQTRPNCGRRVIDQDARDLRDAIASDDGKRYSMSEVMEMMETE